MQYGVEVAEADSAAFDTHGASVVTGGTTLPYGFAITDVTMAADGASPDWNLSRAVFNEGQNIDLWVKYETYEPLTLTRHWDSADIKLNYYESPSSHATGAYTAKLDYGIPYGTAKLNAIYNVDISSPTETKHSTPFPFDILAPAGTTTVTYPITSDGDTSLPSFSAGYAQFVAEDLLTNSDYDYNDFVGRMKVTEYHNSTGNLTQIQMRVKAIARGAGYNADWQLNFGAAFPGATARATVNQYFANGTPHGSQRIWKSTEGVSIPVFSPLRAALPEPPWSFATNTVTGTKYIDGDYSDITIFFDLPVAAGSYTPLPYKPELRVKPSSGSIYTITWWTKPGDMVDANGRPLAFIVPDTFAWPLEYQDIKTVYSGFEAWMTWANSPNAGRTEDPNTYMAVPAPATGSSPLGSDPWSRSEWTGSGADLFHASAPAGQLNTLNLLKYLNGDPTVTSMSIGREVLRPLAATRTYFNGTLPLSLANISNSNNSSSGWTTLRSYLNGVSSTKPLDYQLGGELVTLAMNVERGLVKPDDWVYIPELGEIRPIVSDPRMPGRQGVLASANAAFALASTTANNTTKTTWKNVCLRINSNTAFVQKQPRQEPSPTWYNVAPVASYFRRSQFL